MCDSRELSAVLDGDVLGVDKLAHALERLLAALEDLHLLLRVLMHERPAPQHTRETDGLLESAWGRLAAHLLDHFPQEAEPPWRVDDEDNLGPFGVVLPSTQTVVSLHTAKHVYRGMRRVAYLLDHGGGLAEEVEGVPSQVPQAHALHAKTRHRTQDEEEKRINLGHMAGPRVTRACPSIFSEWMGPEGVREMFVCV